MEHTHHFRLIHIVVLLTAMTLFSLWGLLTSVQAAETTTDRQDNLSASQYSSFGFNDLSAPSTFDSSDTTNPLQGYTPTTLSELYVGQTNRNDDLPDFAGNFFIAENPSSASSSSLNLDNLAKNTIGSTQSYPDSGIYSQCKNVISFKPGNLSDADAGSRRDVIFEDTLYTTENNNGQSKQRLRVLTQDGQNNYQGVSSVTNDLSSSDWVADITVRDQQSYLALAAGDYDNDGAKEVAAYVPTDGGGRIAIYDIEADGTGWKPVEKCSWEVKASGRDRFGFSDGTERPIVNLSTTSMAGHDDLVACVSMPYDDKHTGNSECDVLSVSGNAVNRVFYCGLEYSGTRFKFPSATSADVNGDGTDEIVVAGTKNTGYDNSKGKKGDISSSDNLVNILLYDKSNNQYHFAWSSPQSIHANKTVAEDANDKMNNPIALTAGNYISGSLQDTVFCGGAYYTFAPNSQSGKDPIADGKFTCNTAQDFKMADSSSCFIAQAISATFIGDTDNRMTDQLIVLTGDQAGAKPDQVDMNVSWVYAQNGSLHQEDTNKEYVDSQNHDDNGTCVTLCALNADDDTTYMRYTGKVVGWTDPTIYSIMLSPPYWSELDYGSALNSRGSTSFVITTGTGTGNGNTGNIGQCFGFSLAGGASVLGNSVSLGFSMDESAVYTHSYQESHSHTTSYTCTNGGGDDYVALVLTPLSIYNYDVYIPAHTATQSEVDGWDESIDGAKPNVGDTVPARNTTLGVTVQLPPVYSTRTVSEYNEAAKSYNDKAGSNALSLIDTNELCPGIKNGDPSTYPKTLFDTNVTTKDGKIDDESAFSSDPHRHQRGKQPQGYHQLHRQQHRHQDQRLQRHPQGSPQG